MAAVKKSVWNLGYRIAGMIVFLFSLLHLAPPSWARSITAGARSSSSQSFKPGAGVLMESFLRESRFANQEIKALDSAGPILLAQAGKKVSTETQSKQAMTKQDKTGAAVTKQNQPVQAMKLKQADQPQQAMKLKQTGQPNQAMKLKQADQPKQAMKFKQNAQPSQAMKLKQADQPKQAMKLAQPNKTGQPQQAMKLKQGQQNTTKQ